MGLNKCYSVDKGEPDRMDMAKIQEGFSYENNSKEKHQTNITGRDTFFTYEIPCISGADDHVGGQKEPENRLTGISDCKKLQQIGLAKETG